MLEEHFGREFYLPGCVESRGHLGTGTRVDVCGRRGKGGVIEQVEKLGAELNGSFCTEVERLQKGKIELDKMVSFHREDAPIAVAVLRRNAEVGRCGRGESPAGGVRRDIEPAGGLLEVGWRTGDVGPLCADASVGGVGADGGSEWQARLDGRHAGDLPVANDGVTPRGDPSEQCVTLSKGQVVQVTDHEVVREVIGADAVITDAGTRSLPCNIEGPV